MTGQNVALFLLGTAILSLSLVAAYAVACLRSASPATRSRKSPPESPPTGSFDARFAKLEADQVALFSALEKVCSELKRISSRQVRREEREEAKATLVAREPPRGTPKGELRRFYGLAGKSSTEIARIAQSGVQTEGVKREGAS